MILLLTLALMADMPDMPAPRPLRPGEKMIPYAPPRGNIKVPPVEARPGPPPPADDCRLRPANNPCRGNGHD